MSKYPSCFDNMLAAGFFKILISNPVFAAKIAYRSLRSSLRAREYSRLVSDESEFLKKYLSFEHVRPFSSDNKAELCSSTATSVIDAVETLGQLGVVKWPGFMSDPELADLCAFFEQLFGDYTALENSGHLDDGAYFCPRYNAKFLSRHSSSESSSNRRRVNFLISDETKESSLPSPLVNLLSNSHLRSILCSYFGVEAGAGYVLLEEMTTGPALEWHFDRIADQVKVMFLLSDVGQLDGPLRVRTSSHHVSTLTKPYYHDVFTSGVGYAYPGPGIIESLPGEDFYATGSAGDAIFFNTRTVHSGTQMSRSEPRKVAVATFYPHTPRNKWLSSLAPHWV